MTALPEDLRGDGPCANCGTRDNIVWFTDNVLWNDVVLNDPEAMDKILCIPCFVKETDQRGWHVTGWRLIPEFHYETKDEAAARRFQAE